MVRIYGYIYKIENLLNGKVYVGQTSNNPKVREYNHFKELSRNKHKNTHLQNSFNKYGESNFKFTVLNYTTSKKVLDRMEDDYISHYDCLNPKKGYNLMSGGANGKHSLETRKKISEAKKGRCNPMYGKTGKLNPRYGKKHSIETLRRMSESKKGNKHSLETRLLISKGNKGKTISGETRLKISRSQRGNGLFGFTGAALKKYINPERKPWQARIRHNGHTKSLGYFQDPLSANIVYDLVLNEIYC